MGSSDWGGKPALFCEFDTSLDLILEKTTRLAKFLSERAQAKIDYSKKLKEISQKHQQKYNHIKARSTYDQTTSAVFISILGQTLAAANREEQSARKLLNLINSTLTKHEKTSTEKRGSINTDNGRLKQQLQEQQRRLQSAKNEHLKRKKESEKAQSNWVKCKEKPESTIQEQDKLRNASSDKEALASRSRDELDRQTTIFEQQNGQYYDEQLPNLCRSQQRTFKELTDVWKSSLKEVVKIDIESVSEANKANLGLLHDVDKIDRSKDADAVMGVKSQNLRNTNANNSSSSQSRRTQSRRSPDYVPSQSLVKQFGNLALRKQNSSENTVTTASNSNDNVINFDKLRHLELGRRERQVHKLIDAQKDIIQVEERKQDGLKRLAAASPDNSVTRGVQQQLIDSSMTMKQAQRNVQTLTELLKDTSCHASSPRVRRSTDDNNDRLDRRRDKKRRETTGGVELAWNRPGTQKHHRLNSAATFSFPQATTPVATRARIDDFEVEDHSSGDSGGTIIEKERPEPDGDSQEGDGGSEWDEMSVMETFARGRVLFDFDGDYADLVCLHVKTDEIIEVSLRDEAGWTMARRLLENKTVQAEGYIPTTYYEIIQD